MNRKYYCVYTERLRASGSSAASERNKEMGNPFVHTVHGNPAFTPGKSGKPTVRFVLQNFPRSA